MILRLTQRITVPNKETQEKIDTVAFAEEEDGLTREQCESLGIPFIKRTSLKIDEDGFAFISKKDLEDVFLPLIVKEEEISWASDDRDFGATIYTKNGDTFQVKETVDEIMHQIYHK
jgi:nitrogen fixation protein